MAGLNLLLDNMLACLQGVKDISVQSSVSLQHLPYDVELEPKLPAAIGGKLAFATQKLHEIVGAASKGASAKAGLLASALPTVSTLLSRPYILSLTPKILVCCGKVKVPREHSSPAWVLLSLTSFHSSFKKFEPAAGVRNPVDKARHRKTADHVHYLNYLLVDCTCYA